jgi:putative heme transporter
VSFDGQPVTDGEPVTGATDATDVADPSQKKRARFRRLRPLLRVLLALVAIGVGVWVLSGHSAELENASSYLTQIRWGWLVFAIGLEVGSIVSFALVQQKLLQAGAVHQGLRWLTGVTLANIAISDSLPTGSIIATIFTYRQYRKKGADEVLAGWAMVALLMVTSVTLAVLAAVGVGIAGSESSSSGFVGVTIGVLVVTMVVAILFVQRRALLWGLGKISLLIGKILPNLRFKPDELMERLVLRLNAVHLSKGQVAVTLAWGLANWVLDCGCLILSFTALGIGVPWRGLLLAYGVGQLAANLPITPGGLGVVEGSLVIALVAYGGAEASAGAAVFLYRLISFWGELPFGWVAWGWLARRKKAEEIQPVVFAGVSPMDAEEVSAK